MRYRNNAFDLGKPFGANVILSLLRQTRQKLCKEIKLLQKEFVLK